MSTQIIRPDGDSGKSTWSATPAGSKWSTVDDPVTEPTAGDTTDYVAGASGSCLFTASSYTLTGGETCDGFTIWSYAKVSSGSGSVYNSGYPAANITVTRTTFGWDSGTYSGSIDQAAIDAMTPGASVSGPTMTVATIYIALNIVAGGGGTIPMRTLLGVGNLYACQYEPQFPKLHLPPQYQ